VSGTSVDVLEMLEKLQAQIKMQYLKAKYKLYEIKIQTVRNKVHPKSKAQSNEYSSIVRLFQLDIIDMA
jgi:hypothetical protein